MVPTYNLVQRFDVTCKFWEILTIEYPIGVIGMSCISLPDHRIICFGGCLEDGESVDRVYSFNGAGFERMNDLPPYGGGIFTDPPVFCEEKLYCFSKTGVLFTFDCIKLEWVSRSLGVPGNRV